MSPGISTRPPRSTTRAPSGAPSPASPTRTPSPSATSTAARSRTAAPVPSNRRAPVSHSSPGAGGGAASRGPIRLEPAPAASPGAGRPRPPPPPRAADRRQPRDVARERAAGGGQVIDEPVAARRVDPRGRHAHGHGGEDRAGLVEDRNRCGVEAGRGLLVVLGESVATDARQDLVQLG